MSFCKSAKKCPSASVPYTVREGDTLYKIAASYNASVSDILRANVNLNPYNLNVGQTICVPLPKEQYPQCRTTNYYIAQEGDTFYSIAQKFNVSLNELLAANMGVAPENIYDGIILCIPVAPSPVCLKIKRDGSEIYVYGENEGLIRTYPSESASGGLFLPQNYVLTQKRLDAGDLNGAKELLFSPYEVGIRGERALSNSSTAFVVTDNASMLELFNLAPVGTQMEIL